jgi:carbamoyltransferase
MARHLYDLYKIKNLCIGGGVGLNCVVNWKILKETPFEEIFIQPAAGDDGGAVGAAFFVYNHLLKNKRQFVMRHAFYGPEYQDDDIEIYLKNKNIEYKKLSSVETIEKAADFIAKDKIIGWFQGRMEWGPRALGNRSILANPKNPKIKEIINAKIKHRESFRPFAPSVLKEEALKCFEIEESPFMLFAVPTKVDVKYLVPSVVHIDGTSRIQTVSKEDNGLFFLLIKRVNEKLGVPMVLNTSFNYAGEPIVCTPQDAYQCFLKTGIDYLFLGNFLISK